MSELVVGYTLTVIVIASLAGKVLRDDLDGREWQCVAAIDAQGLEI
jgi:hypothetical protein